MKILSALLCVLMTMSSFTVFAAENTQTAGNDTQKNAVTIYYKGYSNPYIHYQVENGNWTATPGVAMTPDTTVDGYTHSYTIDLGSYSYANVCFNDGHGDWDSQNGRNYHFEKGTYTFKNGVITPVTGDNKFGIESLDTSLSNGKVTVGQSFEISVKLKNATTQAVNKFTYVDPYGNESTIHNYANAYGCAWQFPKTGVYKIRVYSKESYTATDYVMAEKSIIVENKKFGIKSVDLTPADGKVTVGQSFNIDVKLDNATTQAVNKFTSVDANGNEITIHNYANAYGCAWQYYKAGTYKIRVYSKESYNATNYVMAEKTVTVVDDNKSDNQTTIYYKGYSTPYIHYQVENGSWTNAPGYRMDATSEMTGYTHKFTIDLGTKSYVNVCFNDGHGDWDSQNGRNYHFEKGTYTFKNGVITPVTGDNKFGIESLDTSLSNGKVTVGQSFEISVKLKNATTQAVNKFTYVDPYGNESTIHNYANAYGCAWQFPKTGVYKIRVYSKESYTATDYVMAEKSIIVLAKNDLKFTKTYADSETTVDAGYSLYVSADVTGGVAPYKYEFGYTKDGKVTSYTTDDNDYSFYPKEECTLTPFVKVTDATGKTISHTYNTVKVIKGLKVTDINVTPNSPQVVGTKLNIKADIINGRMMYGRYATCDYVIKKDGKVVETLKDPYNTSADWTPTEAGNYTITCNVNDITGRSATKTVNFVVKDKNAAKNVVTIYYKGYSTPYIHYQVGNGNWTAVPGVAMTSTNEKSGYTHKYTIDLGSATYANACFNNGNGSWDSRNGQNYHFEKGTYTFSNGNMTKIAD